MKKDLPSAECLNEFFEYSNGDLIWKSRKLSRCSSIQSMKRFNSIYSGKNSGSPSATGYICVKIFGSLFYSHRIIYKMCVGDIPGGMDIDHINGNNNDNRIENLRVCNSFQNSQNRISVKSISGRKGVSWHAPNSKWCARVSTNGNRRHLGYFSEKIDAINACEGERMRLHNEFANNGMGCLVLMDIKL